VERSYLSVFLSCEVEIDSALGVVYKMSVYRVNGRSNIIKKRLHYILNLVVSILYFSTQSWIQDLLIQEQNQDHDFDVQDQD